MLQFQLNDLISNSDYPGLMTLINCVLEKADIEELALLKQVTLPKLTLNSDELKSEGRLSLSFHFKATHEFLQVPLIAWIVIIGQSNILEKMLELGFDCNAAIHNWNAMDVMLTPLILACLLNETEAVKVLLSHNARLIGYGRHHGGLLDIIALNSKREIIDIVFNHLQCDERIRSILSRTTKNNNSIEVSFDPNAIFENLLLKIWTDKARSAMILNDLRLFSPFIRVHFKNIFKPIPIDQYYPASSLSFFQTPSNADSVSKATQIQNALTDYSNILNNPETCFKLLQKLEKAIKLQLISTWGIESLGDINSEEYTLESHYITQWPVPTGTFKPLKLHSVISFAILDELNKFGLGKSSYKWYGFVPDEIARDHIKNGYYFTENTLDITAILHGKYSHPIQLLILMYAIEENLIKMTYGKDGSLKIKDLLQALVLEATNGKIPWNANNDSNNDTYASFHSPHYTHSAIMLHGKKYGLANLEICLKNSFCKSIIRSMNFHNRNYNGNFNSPKDYWDNLITLINPNGFMVFDITSHFHGAEKHSVRNEVKVHSGACNSSNPLSQESYIISHKPAYKLQETWSTIQDSDFLTLSVNKNNPKCYSVDLSIAEIPEENHDTVELLMQKYAQNYSSEAGITKNIEGHILCVILNKQQAEALVEELSRILTHQNSYSVI